MSSIKRTYLADECSAPSNDNNSSLTDNNLPPSSPSDSPQSKKLRRSSSHHTTESENEDETQEDPYEQENGITNGKILSIIIWIKLNSYVYISYI